jgi:hypothetical protein
VRREINQQEKGEKMQIVKIQPRKDGRYLVSLHFTHGANLRKIMSEQEVATLRENAEFERVMASPRRAWTGGSTPSPRLWGSNKAYRALTRKLYREQVKDSGGLDFWACAGTSAMERARLFWNRARLDAWATIRD